MSICPECGVRVFANSGHECIGVTAMDHAKQGQPSQPKAQQSAQHPYPADGISRGARAIQNADRRVIRYQAQVRELRKKNAQLLGSIVEISEAIAVDKLFRAQEIARAAIAQVEKP